jgi:hypothetical protein
MLESRCKVSDLEIVVRLMHVAVPCGSCILAARTVGSN